MKVLSLFSGIGAFERAIENKNINHEIINYCEKDKYASFAYRGSRRENADFTR